MPAPLILLVHAEISGLQAKRRNLRGNGSGAGRSLLIPHYPNFHLFQVAVVVNVLVQVAQDGRKVNRGEYNVTRLFHALTPEVGLALRTGVRKVLSPIFT